MKNGLSEDTEVLTSKGFVTLLDVTTECKIANVILDSGEVFFENPSEVLIRELRKNEEVYEQEVTAFKSSIISTENHRNAYIHDFGMLTKNIPSITRMDNYIWGGTGINLPVEYDMEDDMLRLVIWVLGDGSIKTIRSAKSENHRVRFGLKKERKIERVINLLETLGLGFSVSCSEKQTEIYINTKSSVALIEIVSLRKRPPFDWVINLSHRQAQLVLKEALQVDGDYENNLKGGSWLLHSTDLETMDFFSALIAVNIGCANMRTREHETSFSKGKKVSLSRVSVIDNAKLLKAKNGLHGRKIIKRVSDYKGKIGCIACDTGFFIARRQGLTFITG